MAQCRHAFTTTAPPPSPPDAAAAAPASAVVDPAYPASSPSPQQRTRAQRPRNDATCPPDAAPPFVQERSASEDRAAELGISVEEMRAAVTAELILPPHAAPQLVQERTTSEHEAAAELGISVEEMRAAIAAEVQHITRMA